MRVPGWRATPPSVMWACVCACSLLSQCVCELVSRGPTFSFVMVICVSVVSFLASCQGTTRYGVRVEDPSSHCDLMLCIAVL